jgi:formylglycine-generating enzyme required for sulfatase activity
VLSEGDRIGDWVVEEPLGEGGMGAVYRVHSALTERLVAALKVLKTTSDPDSRQRFVREAESLSALSHPGIVRVMSFGEDPVRGTPYLAMELAVGETLKSRLQRGPLSPAEAVTAFGPLTAALEHAHAAGIHHRDIKPANVVLGRNGTVKLVDFGIATTAGMDTLATGGHLGTLPYLPPEIFRGDKADPEKIDVYGVGLMLYEALTGERPFAVPPGLAPAAIAAAIGAKKLKQQSFDVGGALPAALRNAVLRATHPLPSERPTMRVLREAIDSLRVAISDRRGRIPTVIHPGQPSASAGHPPPPVPAPARRPAPPRGTIQAVAPRPEERTMRVPDPPGPAVDEGLRARLPRGRKRRQALLAGAVLLAVVGALLAVYASRRSRAAAAAAPAMAPPAETRKLSAGDVWTNARDGLVSVWVPPGRFAMGCTPGDDRCDPKQLPSREVTFAQGFWLERTEVTVGAYKTFARESGAKMPAEPAFNPGWGKDDHPIVNVSWDEARAYCAWAGSRLPSEAEWEYAARGGHPDWFHPWGNEPPACTAGAGNGARFDDEAGCRRAGTERVAAYGASAFGLFDLAGNVWEWCADEWNADFSASPTDGRALDHGAAARRVLRGGSWVNGPDYLRVSIRSRWFQKSGRDFIGFRCARDGDPRQGP